jgi:hypothetical protein
VQRFCQPSRAYLHSAISATNVVILQMQMKKRNALYLYDVSGNRRIDHEDDCLIKRIILPTDLDSHMVRSGGRLFEIQLT